MSRQHFTALGFYLTPTSQTHTFSTCTTQSVNKDKKSVTIKPEREWATCFHTGKRKGKLFLQYITRIPFALNLTWINSSLSDKKVPFSPSSDDDEEPLAKKSCEFLSFGLVVHHFTKARRKRNPEKNAMLNATYIRCYIAILVLSLSFTDKVKSERGQWKATATSIIL